MNSLILNFPVTTHSYCNLGINSELTNPYLGFLFNGSQNTAGEHAKFSVALVIIICSSKKPQDQVL